MYVSNQQKPEYFPVPQANVSSVGSFDGTSTAMVVGGLAILAVGTIASVYFWTSIIKAVKS